jgi:hypothetical protein
MAIPMPLQWYHSQANLIWPDGSSKAFNTKIPSNPRILWRTAHLETFVPFGWRKSFLTKKIRKLAAQAVLYPFEKPRTVP